MISTEKLRTEWTFSCVIQQDFGFTYPTLKRHCLTTDLIYFFMNTTALTINTFSLLNVAFLLKKSKVTKQLISWFCKKIITLMTSHMPILFSHVKVNLWYEIPHI